MDLDRLFKLEFISEDALRDFSEMINSEDWESTNKSSVYRHRLKHMIDRVNKRIEVANSRISTYRDCVDDMMELLTIYRSGKSTKVGRTRTQDSDEK